MERTHIMIHYDEIGLKGKNRALFENRLATNIKNALGENVTASNKEFGQIIMTLAKDYDEEFCTSKLKILPGIANFSYAIKSPTDIESFKRNALAIVKDEEKGQTFRIHTKRHNKEFGLKSQEVDHQVGYFVGGEMDFKAQMKNPDITITIEIAQKNTYIHTKKIESIGGLPVGSAKPVMALLSGGIDSPVAAYLMMKRGTRVNLVHFQNEGQMKHSVQGKIEDLAKRLSEIQGKTKLYIIPFADIQKEIIMHVKGKYRMLTYRRFMLRIAEQLAKQNKIQALVTGDNLSQVASQTIPNLVSVYECVNMPILSPLMGFNKKEITELSKEIGTYEISILPYGDCCSFFVDKSPETNSTIKDMRISEKDMDVQKMITGAIEKAKIVNFE